MIVECIDAGDEYGTGTGLLTLGKAYVVYGQMGGYWDIKCDDGVIRTKAKERFKHVHFEED